MPDVQDNEQVDARDFLEESLREACTSAPKDMELEERCLAAVLPICETAETKKLLNKHCAPVSNEVQRYTPKINLNAFNHILRELENLDAQSTSCRFQEPTDVMFHRNDPKSMKAQRNDMDTSRKPDVILARKQVMIDSQNGRDLDSEKASLDPFDRHIPMLSTRVKNKLRVVRVIHHKELSSLRNGEHLLSGWRDCFECHHALWKGGIEHGDISLRNLMWDPFLKVGILNDFDLINIRGKDSKGGRRTGTIAFMALQLIKPGVKSPRRLYRHDVESLIWVLIWICLYFNGPDDIPQGMEEKDAQEHISTLERWKTGDAVRAFETRASFLLLLDNRVPCKAYTELWNLTEKLGIWLKLKVEEKVTGLNCTEEVEVIHKQIVDIIKEYEGSD